MGYSSSNFFQICKLSLHYHDNLVGRIFSIISDLTIIYWLIALTDKGDHIFIDLIENAKFNKGKNKLYKGVAGNLVAFACKTSFENGYEGVVSFVAKTQLIDHYALTLGAKLFSGNRMFIDTKEAFVLTTKYFKEFRL